MFNTWSGKENDNAQVQKPRRPIRMKHATVRVDRL